MNLTADEFSKLTTQVAGLIADKLHLTKTVASLSRDNVQMQATLTDAQAIGTRQREQIIALKAQIDRNHDQFKLGEGELRRILGAGSDEYTLDAAKRVAVCTAIDGRYHADIRAIREALGAKEGELTVDAAKRATSLSAAHAYGCIERIRATLEPHNCETTEELARKRMSERNDAVTGLAKVSVELSNAKANLAAHKMTLDEIRGLTGSVRESTVREHRDELEGRRGGGA